MFAKYAWLVLVLLSKTNKSIRSGFTKFSYNKNCMQTIVKNVMYNACLHNTERCDPDLEFTCGNGKCIPKSAKCNRKYDCEDQSDERNCRKCSPSILFLCGVPFLIPFIMALSSLC